MCGAAGRFSRYTAVAKLIRVAEHFYLTGVLDASRVPLYSHSRYALYVPLYARYRRFPFFTHVNVFVACDERDRLAERDRPELTHAREEHRYTPRIHSSNVRIYVFPISFRRCTKMRRTVTERAIDNDKARGQRPCRLGSL